MTEQQRKDLAIDLRDMALKMKAMAAQMMEHHGRVAAKGVEMRGAAEIALEWAAAIRRGEE